MKECDRIRSTLLTDYIDNELRPAARREIEEHLLGCPECRQLIAAIKEDMSVISDPEARKELPPYVWQSIVAKIRGEERKPVSLLELVRGLTERLAPVRVVPALVGIAIIIISLSLFLYSRHVSQGYGNGSVEYVAELFTDAGSGAISEHEGLGTPIEECFL